MFNNTNINSISLNLPNYDINNTWWNLDFGNRGYQDRYGNYGAFNTSTLHDITINFNDDNITPITTTDNNLKDSNYNEATNHWLHVTDFGKSTSPNSISLMFTGINEYSDIYINSNYAPMIDGQTNTNIGIQNNFKGTVYFKNSKNWQDIFKRQEIQPDLYIGHSYVTIADIYYHWNFYEDNDVVFRLKGTDISDDTIYPMGATPSKPEFTLQLGSTNTTFTKSYLAGDTWETWINRSASSEKQINYNGNNYPIGIYYIDNTTGTIDGANTNLSGNIIGIGTSDNNTTIGSTHIYKDGYDDSYEDWSSGETYYTNRLNHIYVDNSNGYDKYLGINPKSLIYSNKTYVINLDNSVLSLENIRKDY